MYCMKWLNVNGQKHASTLEPHCFAGNIIPFTLLVRFVEKLFSHGMWPIATIPTCLMDTTSPPPFQLGRIHRQAFAFQVRTVRPVRKQSVERADCSDTRCVLPRIHRVRTTSGLRADYERTIVRCRTQSLLNLIRAEWRVDWSGMETSERTKIGKIASYSGWHSLTESNFLRDAIYSMHVCAYAN